MKQIIVWMFLLQAGFVPAAWSQEQKPDTRQEEKIQALEIAFISRKLQLTTEEAQKFWPVYNEYKRDMHQVMQNNRPGPNRNVVDTEQKMVDVRKKYRERFSGVIGQPRMNQFFQAEREFRGVLLNRLKNQPNRPMLQHRSRN
ncbi:MAG TPA: hypothetical protein PKE63_01785 [Lacibacter sp.]|nr:hypothetical protein [Lacibacter sp.]HMO88746.1 hypothetical protein [Lacibacter sp.]HMP85974.1 hypothetical protein [Lacibacter sp.]